MAKLTTWQKIRTEILIGSGAAVLLLIIGLGIAYRQYKKKNAYREVVLKNVVSTRARITHIFDGKLCAAEYLFEVNKIQFTGKTIGCYDGNVGDTICVLYNQTYPTYNIYCNNKEMDMLWDDVFSPVLIIFSIFATISVLATILRIRRQSRQESE